MIETAELLPDLQGLVTLLHADLLERSGEQSDVDKRLRAIHAIRQKQQRNAQPYEEWREDFLTQVAVAWVLGCVFVRYLEDNRFLRELYLAGPDLVSLRQAKQNFEQFIPTNPHDSERNYLLHMFRSIRQIHALKDIFARTAEPTVEPSNAGAMRLLEFWHEIDDRTGDVKRRFDTARGDTRFLGDLYENLSADVREKYALRQTPLFVEEFILDRTLEPAVAEFGFENVRLIDPTCGSGHFLLGAFARLYRRWERKWEETGDRKDTNRIDLAQRALNQVYGVDLNPYAAAICRFRLIIAAMNSCELRDLEQAPAWTVHVAVGDSLYHGWRFDRKGGRKARQRGLVEDGRDLIDPYDMEDPKEADRILGQQYHAVVGNPPYITVKDKNLNGLYRGLYSTCYRLYSLGVPFTERFFDLALVRNTAQGAGYIGMITANSFMKRDFGKKLIEEFFPKYDLTHVIDTSPAHPAIENHGTATVILFGRNQEPAQPTIRSVLGIRSDKRDRGDPTGGRGWKAIVDSVDIAGTQSAFLSVVDSPRAVYEKHPWSIGGGGAAELKELIEEHAACCLGSVLVDNGRTTHTGEDGAFFVPPDLVVRLGLGVHAVPVVTGEDVRDWGVSSSLDTLFPYDCQEGLPVAVNLPSWHRHFWALRRRLKNRVDYGSRIEDRGLRWFDHSMFFPARFRTPLSITYAFVATHNQFTLDYGGKVFNRHAPVLKLGADVGADQHHALLGLLNSSTACFWFKQVCYSKGAGGINEGVKSEQWEQFREFAGGIVNKFPLPTERHPTLPCQLDTLARHYSESLPGAFMRRSVPTAAEFADNRCRAQEIRRRQVALQEELDWQVYHLYGLTPEPLTYLSEPPPLNLGERAFEIVMARQMARKELETTWFTRHASKPITDLPGDWPEGYRRLVERRIKLIEGDRTIGLIEQPDYKRRWAVGKGGKTFDEAWAEFEKEALRGWLLDRLENERYWPRPQPGQHSPAELKSCRELARLAALDPEFQQVGELYTGRKDFDVQKLVTELVLAESVPFLPVLRYTDSGLRKREVWERVWETQRAEDRGEQVEVEVPPKYKKDDFQKDELGKDGLWRLRGELDVPKERWVSYPPLAERQGDEDPSPVVTWAGYDHLDQALALATYFDNRTVRDAGSKEWALPLLAGLDQLMPWLLQWHNAPNPAYEGQRMGDYFRGVLRDALQTQDLTIVQCRAWRPPPPARKPRQKRKK